MAGLFYVFLSNIRVLDAEISIAEHNHLFCFHPQGKVLNFLQHDLHVSDQTCLQECPELFLSYQITSPIFYTVVEQKVFLISVTLAYTFTCTLFLLHVPFVCLFLARQPPVGHGLLIHEVSRSHTTTHHSR